MLDVWVGFLYPTAASVVWSLAFWEGISPVSTTSLVLKSCPKHPSLGRYSKHIIHRCEKKIHTLIGPPIGPVVGSGDGWDSTERRNVGNNSWERGTSMGMQGVRSPWGSGVSQSTKVITLCQERAQCLQHLSAAVVHVLMSYIFLIFIFYQGFTSEIFLIMLGESREVCYLKASESQILDCAAPPASHWLDSVVNVVVCFHLVG